MLCQQSLTRMEKAKVRSNSKTVSVSILQSLSIFICFVALTHVELELHAHRDTIRVLTSQHTEENPVARNTVNDETSHSSLTETHNDLAKGLYMSPLRLLKYTFFRLLR